MSSLYPQDFLLTPVSGIGALHASGRFNVAGVDEHRVTYLAAHPHVSMREYRYTTASAQGNSPDLPPAHAVPPVVLFSVTYDLHRILDLANKTVRNTLGIKASDLSGHWWRDNEEGEESDTQILSRLVYASGQFDAIKFLSARDSSSSGLSLDQTCFAVFPDRLMAPSYLLVEPPASGIPQGAIYQLP